MRSPGRIFLLTTFLSIAIFGTWRGEAFSLLGPFQSWMEPTNGYDLPGDIGGPMSIGEGYRWNVPVITYGFDQSFVDFFGTNGEAAVENAVQILNNLPPASQVALTNYPYNSMNENYTAQAQSLIDLKSYTLPLLLEQMGLASPSRYVFVLKQWNSVFISPSPNEFSSELNWPDWVYPDYISERNFDPQTMAASHYVNDTLYTGAIETFGDQNSVIIMAVDPFSGLYTAVTDGFSSLSSGGFFTGLTRDDVGGLRYLFSTNNIAYETLLPDVAGSGTNAYWFVNGAWRPGIEKITFVRQPTDPKSGKFRTRRIPYTDTYITNGIWMHQQLTRTISKPDFLFCAADLRLENAFPVLYERSGTTNWINNAAVNGNPGGEGPGVICPQARIVFDKFSSYYYSDNWPPIAQTHLEPESWSSFDGSTNPPVIYPVPKTGANPMAVRIWIYSQAGSSQKSFTWKLSSAYGTQYVLQCSTDLVNWATLITVTNTGSICTFFDGDTTGPAEYYRLQPVNF
jgi:hypothetical protein